MLRFTLLLFYGLPGLLVFTATQNAYAVYTLQADTAASDHSKERTKTTSGIAKSGKGAHIGIPKTLMENN